MPRFWRWSLGSTLILIGMGLGVWFFAPWCVEDPLPGLEARRPATIYCDRYGTPLYAQRGWDAQWRFPVPLKQIHPEVIRATLAAEDADFYRHGGVDYGAALRALWQNVSSGRIVSGASTISMQVVSLAMGRERSLWAKFLQAARARKMEHLHSKDEILSAYLNHIPFGGKFYGIEAAARYYFGLSASELTFAETTFLCGIPQRPNALRPDRYPKRTRQRQQRLLKMMVRRNLLTQEDADACFQSAPVRLRDFSQPADFQRIAQPNENLHALLAGYPISAPLQEQVLRILHNHIFNNSRLQTLKLDGVRDAACVVMRKGEIVAYIGTLCFGDPKDGQVDAAKALRSAGSVLKPFIFAEAIEGGLLVPETKLLDAPVRYGDYTPTNYDIEHYFGVVSAGEALAKSLNTPVIRLLEMLGDERLCERFTQMGLPPAKEGGLTLALGTGGAKLVHLVRAYEALPRTFSPGTAALIAKMLRQPLPNCSLDVAWKTGTANNNTDAWCVGWTPDIVVGVWVGNKDGMPSDAIVGVTVTAPIVGEVMTQLYQYEAPPHWDEVTTTSDLCAISGLAKSTACSSVFNGTVHPIIPLKRCDRCNMTDFNELQILSPIPRTYYGTAVTFNLCTNQEKVLWLCNGQWLGEVKEVTLPVGQHTLCAIPVAGELKYVTLVITPIGDET